MTSVLFEAHALPVLQNRAYVTKAEALACTTGDIRLQQDPKTGIVTNMAFDPARVVYDTDYNNEQANSTHFQTHLDDMAMLVQTYLGCRSLVEIGCGKGYFLERLLDAGLDVTGFDPAYDGSNPRVRRAAFEPGLDMRAKGLILRHVLEHIPQPAQFLCQLAHANGGKGLIYIEVPCLEWIIYNRSWFDIFYEHVNYFRLSDFDRLFGRIIHSGRVFGGQYLAIVADLGSLRMQMLPDSGALCFPADFGPSRPAVSSHNAAPLPELIWGAASKGVIYSLMRQRQGHPVSGVIDINPAKQGRFLPCTGLQVLSPASGLRNLPRRSTIRVMNLNYLHEVRALAGPDYHYIGACDD